MLNENESSQLSVRFFVFFYVLDHVDFEVGVRKDAVHEFCQEEEEHEAELHIFDLHEAQRLTEDHVESSPGI